MRTTVSMDWEQNNGRFYQEALMFAVAARLGKVRIQQRRVLSWKQPPD